MLILTDILAPVLTSTGNIFHHLIIIPALFNLISFHPLLHTQHDHGYADVHDPLNDREHFETHGWGCNPIEPSWHGSMTILSHTALHRRKVYRFTCPHNLDNSTSVFFIPSVTIVFPYQFLNHSNTFFIILHKFFFGSGNFLRECTWRAPSWLVFFLSTIILRHTIDCNIHHTVSHRIE